MSYKAFRELLPHEQKAVDALIADGRKINRTADNCIRSSCPSHDGEDENLTVYFNDDGIAFNCHSKNCTHADIIAALRLTQKDILPGASRAGLTLLEYAIEKKLAPSTLVEYHVREVTGYKGPRIEIDYLGFEGLPIHSKVRKSMVEKPVYKAGDEHRLYGMWRHQSLSDYFVIVEGESDCHTLWSHGISAVGVPGAQVVEAVLPDIERLFQMHPDLQPYVFLESDASGKDFVKRFEKASFASRIKIVSLEGFKDASELHCKNPDPVAFEKEWNIALEVASEWVAFILATAPKSLSDLAPIVRNLLNGKRLARERKEYLATQIGNFLTSTNRLLLDVSNESDPMPYMLTDNGAAVILAKGVKDLTFALQDCGMQPTEELFNWTIDALVYRADREGKHVKLERYSVMLNKKLYVSSGTTKIVVAEVVNGKVSLQTSPNGKDGVLFAADACFPDWKVSEPIHLDDIAAFRPTLEAPEEAPEYCPEYQRVLLQAWIACRIIGFSSPILTSIGAMASGKSITQRAVVKMFMGAGKDVCNSPDSQRGFFSAATSFPVYMIDNLDKDPDAWFADAIASACTGVIETDRKLFKNSEVFSKPVTANFGITTRSALFASRPDIQDRLLPLFYGVLPDTEKKDETLLLNEVSQKRDGLLTRMVEVAATCLFTDEEEVRGLPGRFQPFARIAKALGPNGIKALNACEIAKRLSVVDGDPVTEAIHHLLKEPDRTELRGTAIEIGRKLSAVNPDLRDLGGKTFARRLREVGKTLTALGYRMIENRRSDGSTEFTISRRAK